MIDIEQGLVLGLCLDSSHLFKSRFNSVGYFCGDHVISTYERVMSDWV